MARKTTVEHMNDLAKEDANRIIEGYRKGGHTCKECGRVCVWIGGCQEFKDKVKRLLAKEMPLAFDNNWTIDGYCPDCRWERLGTGLEVTVVMKATREEKESPTEIIKRLKSRLGNSGLPFKISGIERRHSGIGELWG